MDIDGFIQEPFENELDRLRHLARPLAHVESQVEHIRRLTEQVCSADKMLQQKHQCESQAYAAMELKATIQRIEARDPRFCGDKHIPDRWTSFPPLQSLTFAPSQKDRIKALEERVRQLESMHKPSPPPPDNGANRSDGGQYL